MTRNRFRDLGRTAQGGVAAFLFALVCLLAGAFQEVAPAAAACPNEVFRTGPSAKLPECRAYELVTPPYTGGAIPTATNFWNVRNIFDWPLITAGGDSVIYNTIAGSLTGTPGNGETDRYRAKRTPQGWITEFIGPSAQQTPRAIFGGVSADHQYYFLQAGNENDFALFPGASLLAPFGGGGAAYLHKPDGDFELIAKGSLGSARKATGYLTTPGATHVVFSTETKLEPQAPPSGNAAIYDRSVGGPTHVVSLLPGNVTPTEGETVYLGASEDANDVAFAQVKEVGSNTARFYVRHGNATTREVARSNGAVVGRKLTCEGTGGSSVSYQWLRNGVPIVGATSATYTVAQADEGDALQCRVAASASEGESLQASLPPVVVAPYEGIDPPFRDSTYYELAVRVATPQPGFSAVGEVITCEPDGWTQSPTYSYQWFRNGTEIGGATDATYTPVGVDEETGLQCRLTASNADGTAIAFSSVVPVHPVPLTETADPEVSNLTNPGSPPEAGDELACSQGTWNGSPSFSYQWLRNGAAIAGATGSIYTVASPADDGATLQCRVTATSAGVTTQAISNRLVAEPQPGTVPPEPENTFGSPGMIFGVGGAPVGEALFCSGGQWSGESTIGFQWLIDGAELAGATEEVYVPTQADVGATLQCRVTATNAGGTTVATYAGAEVGPRVVAPGFPLATSSLAPMSLAYGGIFGGNVFYGDKPGFGGVGIGGFQAPSDLYSYSIADGTTTRITDVGDARFSFVSKDGSRVYFLSQSEIAGEGVAGEQNLYLWSRAGGSTKLIATVGPEDAYQTGLGRWTEAVVPNSGQGERGLGAAQIRESADGSTFLFTTTAQLTSFDNQEATPEDCGYTFFSGERCAEIYRYELASGNLTCVSCPPGSSGPATGAASLQGGQVGPYANNPVANLMADGKTVFFQSAEDLLTQDGNQNQDVYRWKEGAGLALISTGQQPVDSGIYGITPNGSDVTFVTSEPLVPEDENGGSRRIYDARVNGGFPPPESTVTEPCSGDACQGNPSAAPESPGTPSASLNGGGNVHPKLRCPKGERRVVRHGKQRCVKRRHRKKKHRHATANRGTVR